MVVRIFDVSAMCYAGSLKPDVIDGPIVKADGPYTQLDLPAGGISYIFNQVARFYQYDVLIFTCDRFPEIKTQMLQDYKATRKHDRKVDKMKAVAEHILRDCGFPTIAYEGYESDDIMYTLCKEFTEMDEVEHVYIYSGDSDLYLCINDKVSAEPVHKRDKRVTKDNFEYTVSSKGNVPYNTVTLNKILYGDTSDNIPALPSDITAKMLKYFCYPELYRFYGDKDYVTALCNSKIPEALPQVNLVFPLEAPIDDASVYLHVGNKERVLAWADAMDHQLFPTYTSLRDDIADHVFKMVEEGLSL